MVDELERYHQDLKVKSYVSIWLVMKTGWYSVEEAKSFVFQDRNHYHCLPGPEIISLELRFGWGGRRSEEIYYCVCVAKWMQLIRGLNF